MSKLTFAHRRPTGEAIVVDRRHRKPERDGAFGTRDLRRKTRAPWATAPQVTAVRDPAELETRCGNSTSRSRLYRKLGLVQSKPQEAARLCQTELKHAVNSCNEIKYENACVGYELASCLRGSERKWENFKDYPFWDGFRRSMRIEDALRLSLMFVYGDRQGRMADTARDHARKLQGAWRREVSTRQVFEDLQARKFSGLVGAPAAGRTKPLGKPTANTAKRSFHIRKRADRALGQAKVGQLFSIDAKVRKGVGGKPTFVITRAVANTAEAPRETPRSQRFIGRVRRQRERSKSEG